MKVFMTGGTGFVGSYLSKYLAADGHAVTILTMDGTGGETVMPGISRLAGHPTVAGKWQDAVRDHGVIINLAGASIFSRWTETRKQVLRTSRIETTRNLVDALPDDARHITFFSTSAVGYYGFHEDEELAEDSPAGEDFLARLANDWEREALRGRDKKARVVLMRFGIVLGRGGGALGQMVPLFKYFLGGPLGSGRQWLSWVHMHDLAEAFAFLLRHQEIAGPVNICSPQPVRNRQLGNAIGRVLHRPSSLPAPAFLIKFFLGEFGSVLLRGQRVVPRRLLNAGFEFRYPEIVQALQNIIET